MQFQIGPTLPLSASAPPRVFDGENYVGWVAPTLVLSADNQYAECLTRCGTPGAEYGHPIFLRLPGVPIPAAANVLQMTLEYRAYGTYEPPPYDEQTTKVALDVFFGESWPQSPVRHLYDGPTLSMDPQIYTVTLTSPSRIPNAVEMSRDDFRLGLRERAYSNVVDPPRYNYLYVDYIKVTIIYEFRGAHVAVGVSQIY